MIYDYYKEKSKKGINKGFVSVMLILLIIAVGIISVNIYQSIIEYDEIGGFSQVYLTNLTYKAVFFIITFLVILAAISITTRIIKRNVAAFLKDNNLEPLKLPSLPIAFVLALMGAFLIKENLYLKALSFLNSTGFGSTDQIFNNDIGYYIFERPFYMGLYEFFAGLGIFLIIYTAALYFILLTSSSGRITLQDFKTKSIIRHNLVNITLFFLIKAFSYKFEREGILYSTIVNLNGVDINGAGYTDINIWLKYYTAVPFVLAIIIAVAFFQIWKGSLRKAAYTIAVLPVLWIIVSVSAAFVQSIIVRPNAISVESQYMKYNIEKTREAFGLDRIKIVDFQQVKDISADVINRNAQTRDNIRVVDYKATLDTNMQLQSNTNFYNFNDGDIINYTVNGKEVPVLISAREIDKNRLPEKSYINTMFKYTHGYGVVINPVNKVTNEGQADFILGGLKMNSADKSLKVAEPRIYYGELTKDHVIVNNPESGKLKEIDYDGSIETSYTGKGGIKLGLLNRLIFTAKYVDPNMIISGNISSNSRLLLNREIITRVQKAVPFLTVDKDPYIILTSDGRLVWVIDAYTTTDNYPYSQNIQGINYIKNSVKITVDAYDGTVKYYIIDKNDPIVETYSRIYPGLFTKDSLPEDIAAHSRYPEMLFKIQTEMMKRYHLDPGKDEQNVSKFFSNQDLWSIAKYPQGLDAETEGNADSVRDIDPYYNMIRLPQISQKEELILMRPFTPAGKHNMVSWLAVRNSAENYGELILFNFPKDTNILGPYQVESSINSIDKVSKDMTLWGQSGSRVFKGNLLVIPIEESVLYVEPIYIQYSGASSIPQIREIIVGYQKGEEFKYGIGANFNEALNNLLGVNIQAPQTPQQPEQAAQTPAFGSQKLINDILSRYDELRKQMEELDKLMQELR